jgi:hypothetical protein
MARIILARGLIMTLDDNEAGPDNTNDPNEYTRLGYNGYKKTPLTTKPFAPLLSQLKDGDCAYFGNDPLYRTWPMHGAYLGENVITVGDTYYGYNVGLKSYLGWLLLLRQKALDIGIPFPNPSAYNIQLHRAAFLDVPRIAMNVFDLRSNL